MEEKDLTMVNFEETEENEEIEETPERSGIGTGWAMLIGSGLTLAAIAVGKKAKKVWRNYKAKKEQSVEDSVVIEVVPEEDENAEDPEPGEGPDKKQK